MQFGFVNKRTVIGVLKYMIVVDRKLIGYFTPAIILCLHVLLITSSVSIKAFNFNNRIDSLVNTRLAADIEFTWVHDTITYADTLKYPDANYEAIFIRKALRSTCTNSKDHSLFVNYLILSEQTKYIPILTAATANNKVDLYNLNPLSPTSITPAIVDKEIPAISNPAAEQKNYAYDLANNISLTSSFLPNAGSTTNNDSIAIIEREIEDKSDSSDFLPDFPVNWEQYLPDVQIIDRKLFYKNKFVSKYNTKLPWWEQIPELKEMAKKHQSATTTVDNNGVYLNGPLVPLYRKYQGENTGEGNIVEKQSLSADEAYQITIEEVYENRKRFENAYKKAVDKPQQQEQILKEAWGYLENVIAEEIVHFWYGVPFDKEGLTTSPRSGSIACSYFVATMFMEAGLKVNRIKLAQKSALEIAQAICSPQYLTHFTTPSEVETFVAKRGKGLYVIGFSYHVGFLYNDGRGQYLIHASPLPPGTVYRLDMKGARSFDYSEFYDVGKLSDYTTLVECWVTGKQLPF